MADFDKSTFDPKAAAEARKKEMDQMAEKLEAGVKDVFRGENYKAFRIIPIMISRSSLRYWMTRSLRPVRKHLRKSWETKR